MSTLSIRWGSEIRIINPCFILDGYSDPVVSFTPLSKIVGLEVRGLFGESISDRKKVNMSSEQ